MTIEENPLFEDFKVTKLVLHMVLKNRRPPGSVISGPPGLGKTHTVREIYREHHNEQIPEFRGSYRGLIDFVSEHRDAVIMLDDYDRAFYDPEMLSLFKKLLDSNEPRIISHTVMGKTAVAPFQYKGGVVICTNLDLDNPKLWSPAMYQGYIAPFKSRLSNSIVKLTFDKFATARYAIHIAPQILASIRPLNGRKLTTREKDELIEYFEENWQSLPDHSPRMIHNLGELRIGALDMKYSQAEWELLLRRRLREWSVAEKEAQAARAKTIQTWKHQADRAIAEEVKH